MTAVARSKLETDPDGAAVEIFPLPGDETSLEKLLRDLFERHWDKITFGPLIQGAAWEIRAPHAPTHLGMLDGYLTVAFGPSHFHLCIGPHAPNSIGVSTKPALQSPGACACSTARVSSR